MRFEKERKQISEWKITHDFDAYFNGCGAGKLVYKCEEDFIEACKVHDFLYIKQKFTRKICDDIFLDDMLLSRDHWSDTIRAYTFYFIVRLVGWLWYYKIV